VREGTHKIGMVGHSANALWSVAMGLARDARSVVRRRAKPPVFFTNEKPEYEAYEIGEWTYGSPKVLDFGDGGTLKIGRFCSIAEGVTIFLGGEHRWDWVTTYPFNVICPGAHTFQGHPRSKGPVVVGNDVWIGRGATILSGVTIGDGAVVAASSVVAKGVPPYSILAGNPARHIRYRFSEAQIAALLRIRWWDWPIEKIREAWPLLLRDNVDAFIRAYGKSETGLASLAT
jgi:virginiamycin A acetyltransferase